MEQVNTLWMQAATVRVTSYVAYLTHVLELRAQIRNVLARTSEINTTACGARVS